jgi:hypothetical protein
MSKKYLSLEEAAAHLGMEPAELNRLRERNEIRAFADRGDWKFIDRLQRSRQADSDPDVPLRGHGDSNDDTGELLLDDDDSEIAEMPTIIRKIGDDSDSDVQLTFDDTIQLAPDSGSRLLESDSDVQLSNKPGQQKTGTRPSDSDVKLVSRSGDAGSDAKLVPGSGDSSVRLVSQSGILKKSGSDSDVKISDKGGNATDSDVKISRPRPSDSDSDVQLMGGSLAGTDSDIRIVGPSPSHSDSDSDVKLTGLGGTDSDIRMADSKANKSGILKRSPSSGFLKPPTGATKKPESGITGRKGDDSGIALAPQSSGLGSGFNLNPVSGGSVLDEDSGLALNPGSGILMAGESGINLGKPSDSGISLDDEDLQTGSSASGISLEPDSGITLDAGSSGISLEAGDSGISLEDMPTLRKSGSSNKLTGRKTPDLKKTDGEIDITVPMPAYSGDDDIIDTQMEIPLLNSDSSMDDIKLANTSDGMTFSDSSADSEHIITLADEGDVDEYAGTLVKKGRGHDDDDDFDSETFETAAVDSGAFDNEEPVMEVSDEIAGEDDELEEIDVFGADDDDFADSGVEEAEEVLSARSAVRGIAAPVEHEWGVPTFLGVAFATVLMLLCGSITFDLVRNTWHSKESTPITGTLLNSLSDMFKK